MLLTSSITRLWQDAVHFCCSLIDTGFTPFISTLSCHLFIAYSHKKHIQRLDNIPPQLLGYVRSCFLLDKLAITVRFQSENGICVATSQRLRHAISACVVVLSYLGNILPFFVRFSSRPSCVFHHAPYQASADCWSAPLLF